MDQASKLTLYDDPHSLFCAKTRVVLIAKGLPYKSVAVPCGSTSSPEFRKIAPLGKIPVLVVDNVKYQEPLVLMESEVINEWLEETFPHAPALMPSSPTLRAQVRTISRFHDLYLEAALRKTYSQVAPAKRDPAVVAAAAAEFRQRLSQLEHLLMEADRYTAAEQAGAEAGEAMPADATAAKQAEVEEGIAADVASAGAASQPAALHSASATGPCKHAGYSVGHHLSLADAGFGPLFLYADLILDALGYGLAGEWASGSWPRVARLRQALSQDPYVTQTLQLLEPGARGWLEGKLSP